jgi:hypothetical protein
MHCAYNARYARLSATKRELIIDFPWRGLLKFSWLKKPIVAASLLVLLWATWRLAVLKQTGFPAPRVHDEFSYLLGADTFAHGRLANPPHPLAKFFESFHVLVRPVYASKYPPGQAMFLALGQKLFGHPFYGVLISNAFMLFTTCLMLYAWVPARWALAVSGMLALCLWPGMYWTNSYWGGSVAASGGALVLLGIGRYLKRQTSLSAAIFVVGILLLFWTRPYEGGVFTVAVLAVFAKELWLKRRLSALVIAAPLLLVGAAWTCYYNQAITGHLFRLPYIEYDDQYDVAPPLSIMPLRPEPKYSHPRLAAAQGFHGWEVANYVKAGSHWLSLFTGLGLALVRLALWPAILLTVMFPLAEHEPTYRKMLIVTGILLFALAIETFHQEHYSAPVWAAVALMTAVWAERACNLKFRRLPAGKVLVPLALIAPLLAALPDPTVTHDVNAGPPDWENHRAAMIQRLSALSRPQLVIVRYPSPGWRILEEWVYNGADIDQQKVIFARDFGTDENRALLRYYRDRTVCLLTFNPDTGQEHLEPYPSAQSE